MEDREYLKKYLPKEKYNWGLKKLEEGLPVQYIVGNTNFYGSIIKVNKNVLIPRFETELLVEKTIKLIKKYFSKEVSILDIGTGSGSISIALAKNIACKVEGVDISKPAIEVAKENSKLNLVNVNFYESDIFSNVKGKYDVIISNPPYISHDEKIMDIVYNNEPHLALFAPDKGLYFYDKILSECSKYIEDNFLIAFEIGESQGEEVTSLVHKYLDNVSVVVEKDYNNRDRFVFISNLFWGGKIWHVQVAKT